MKNGRLEILNVFDVVGISAELACLVISDVLALGNSAPGSPLGRKPTTGRSANLEAGGYPVVSGMGFPSPILPDFLRCTVDETSFVTKCGSVPFRPF